jgi:chorismate mutase/prephenate dehydrogenase
MTTEPTPRPLPIVRAMIDTLDRELLEVVARRMGLVAEIAAFKRLHGLHIRDPKREREVIDDRCRRAEELGLPRGEMESVFRILLRASRDRQASLGAELPPELEPRTVAVIGGRGQMGQVLVRMFGDLGHHVLVSDLDTELTPTDAATAADVVIVSVPIDATEALIREIGPRVRQDALLMDVTSIKQGPVAAMMASTQASVVGTHPMFGPSVHTLQGQRVVICRARGDAWGDWVERMFEARGLTVTETTPEQHDRIMAVVQVLTHFQTQVQGLTLARIGVPLDQTLQVTSPAYLIELYVAARHFAQSPALYGPIEMRNPRMGEVTTAFRTAAAEMAEILATGDRVRFDAVFSEVRQFFGHFTDEALEQSAYLIDRIVERM